MGYDLQKRTFYIILSVHVELGTYTQSTADLRERYYLTYSIKYFISVSKSLPTIQPKQECPGFKCISGISKCIPMKRMCDKIVDCLDGEDEINCESTMRATSSLSDFFVSTSKENIFERKENLDAKKVDNSSSEETSSDEELHKAQVETIPGAQSTDSNNTPKKEPMIATVSQTATTDTITTQLHNDENFKITTIPTINDLEQQQINEIDLSGASTNTHINVSSNIDKIENASKSSFELNLTSPESAESITVDPDRSATNDEIESTNRGDIQSFSTLVSKVSPESRSSVLGNKDADIHEDLSDVLILDFPTSLTTTTTETPTTHHEKTLIGNTSNQNTGDSNHKSNVTVSKQNQTNASNSTHLSDILKNENTDLESKHILIDLPDQSLINNEDNSTESDANHLFSSDKKGILDKIKDILASQLQPPKQKLKHLIPYEFQCQR